MEMWSQKKSKKIERDFILLELIEHKGWTWSEIQNAPNNIVELAIWKMNIDNKK